MEPIKATVSKRLGLKLY